MKISIRSRLMLSFVAVIALVLVCQLIFNVFFATQYYRSYQENGMHSAYSALKDSFDGTSESVELAVSGYENDNNIEVLVWFGETLCYTSYDRFFRDGGSPEIERPSNSAMKGQVQQMPQEEWFEKKPDIVEQENASLQNEQKTGGRQEVHTGVISAQEAAGNVEVLRLLDTFTYQDQVVMVTISISLASVEQSAEVFLRSSMLISMMALLIGLGYSLALSKSITKPLLEINQIAGKLSNLDFSRKANEDISSVELHDLSQSINSMSAQLEKAILALNVANKQLKQDIDSQKQIEQMRREFVGNVSHEMKTPLTMLQIYAESLKNNMESVDKNYYCDTIIEETETLNDLVASMLDISSIESGLSKMQMEAIELSAALSLLIARMQPMLAAYELTCEIAPELAVVGDEKYLAQAMKNYITNAIEHTKKGGRIIISLRQEREGIIYRVENQGNQIAVNEIPRLWDSFYRSDKARSRSNKNVGLGLHIVKTVIEKHAGICTCENTEMGVAFSFCISKGLTDECKQ